ncbi:short-chain dehydrogenase/reductase [Bacteroidia bacterium]|nr:short-chain dehydrogenase/reductase [Bacteroidia bacterium]
MNKKIVVITGASSGIGRATAIYLAESGYIVYGGARRADKLSELVQYGVKTLQLDVTNDSSAMNFIDTILKNEGQIDVLINNAGYGEYGAIEDVPIENAKNQIDVNVFGLAKITQLVLPSMRKHKCGKIINISSIGGRFSSPMGGWYYASKYAVEALSDSLRMEVKQFGIDVILIEPGGISTEWGGIADDLMMKASDDSVYSNMAKRAHRAKTLFQRLPQPIVIAKIIKRAIEAKHPRHRYIKGFMAKPLLLLKKWLPSKCFDKLILTQF